MESYINHTVETTDKYFIQLIDEYFINITFSNVNNDTTQLIGNEVNRTKRRRIDPEPDPEPEPDTDMIRFNISNQYYISKKTTIYFIPPEFPILKYRSDKNIGVWLSNVKKYEEAEYWGTKTQIKTIKFIDYKYKEKQEELAKSHIEDRYNHNICVVGHGFSVDEFIQLPANITILFFCPVSYSMRSEDIEFLLALHIQECYEKQTFNDLKDKLNKYFEDHLNPCFTITDSGFYKDLEIHFEHPEDDIQKGFWENYFGILHNGKKITTELSEILNESKKVCILSDIVSKAKEYSIIIVLTCQTINDENKKES